MVKKILWVNITILVISEKVVLVTEVHVISWLPGLLHRDTSIPGGIQCLLKSGLYGMAPWQLLSQMESFGVTRLLFLISNGLVP